MNRNTIPFAFVVDELFSLRPIVKPFFGMFSVYIDTKIVLILRQRKQHPEANGVWIATTAEHHATLRKDLPSLCSIPIYTDGTVETGWQMLPEAADDFEQSAIKVCELILNEDERIGKIPKPRRKKNRV